MKKTAVIMIILTLMVKPLGFIREVILAYAYGASSISDAYLIAMSVPNLLISVVGAGLSTTFIPIYSKLYSESEEKADVFTSRLLVVCGILCVVITVIGGLFSEEIVKLMASGFTGDTLDLATNFSRITIIGTTAILLCAIINSYLQIKQSFIPFVLWSIPTNAILISTIIASVIFNNVYIMVCGSVASTILQLPYLWIFAKRQGFRFKMSNKIWDSEFKSAIILAIPVMLGSGIGQINMIIDKTLASQVVEGGISALTYATKFTSLIQGLFVGVITMVIYPVISKMVIENNKKGVADSIKESILSVSAIVLPITVGAIIFATPIIELVFKRGTFDNTATILTSQALVFYSIGIIGHGLNDVLSKYFYAYSDTKTPVICGVIGIIINIAVNLMLYKVLGLKGLALATSVAALCNTLMLLITLRRKIGYFGLRTISKSFVKMAIASLLMGLAASIIFNLLMPMIGQLVALLITIIIAALIYAISIYMMKIEEVENIVWAVQNKISDKPKKK